MMERVQKILSQAGVCSRRKAESLIQQGRVTVNDKKITLGDKADINKDTIKLNNKPIRTEKKVYIKLNKPKNYETTCTGEKSVLNLINTPQRVFPVGRLDKDATGLLLLTNDGEWANKIAHPSNETEKEYHVKLEKPLTKESIKELREGIKLKDCFIKPKVKVYSKNNISITIHQGRNKIVKRIFKTLGYKVTQLKRVRVGKYHLNKLKSGEWCYL